MLRYAKLDHRFVQYVPEGLEPGVLYISMEYATAAHSCCCGCGLHVITPFSPTDWKMTFDGETVSLWPSIGNWNFPCRSHYIIRNSRVVGSEPWKENQIKNGRDEDKHHKEQYYDQKRKCEERAATPSNGNEDDGAGIWDRIKKRVRKRRRK